MNRIKRDVLTGSIPGHLFKLALPSMGGMLAIIIFNITDTYFVSRLGDDALAAMGFTFPVVMIIGAISSGISMGAGSILARAMGRGDHHLMSRIASDGILLSLLAVVIIGGVGITTMEPLFLRMGADEKVLPLVIDYMFVWYAGVGFVIMPPVSDSCMRAMGDMVRPLGVMLLCALINFILDPILIFGWFGFPAMGIKGAAVATLVARFCAMVLSLSFVHFHYKLLDFKVASFKELLDSWLSILKIGIPNVFIRLLPQVVRTLLTKNAALAAGMAGVAAIAAGSRIESFSTIVSMAVGAALIPVIGQNYGAGNFGRVNQARKIITGISVLYGLFLFLVSLGAASPLAGIFTKDPKVQELTSVYLKIVFLGSIGLNLYNWMSEGLNAVGKPFWSLIINLLGTVLFILPLVWIGTEIKGFTGMILGLAAGQFILGIMAWFAGKSILGRENPGDR